MTWHIDPEKLIAFASGELDFTEAKAVARHTTYCAECTKTANQFKVIRLLMRGDTYPVPSSATVARAQSIFAQARAHSQHYGFNKLIALATDKLNPGDSRAVAEHTNFCGECYQTVARYKLVQDLIATTTDERMPPRATVARAQAIFKSERRAAMPFWKRRFAFAYTPTVRRFSMAVMLVLLVLSNVVLYVGVGQVVDHAQLAIPGDVLYSTKLTMERIQLMTTWSADGKLTRHLAYAGFRVNETAALVSLDRLLEIPSTLAAYEDQINTVLDGFQKLAKQDLALAQSIAPHIESTVSTYSATLGNLRQAAGDLVAPMLEQAIRASDAGRVAIHDMSAQPTLPGKVAPTLTKVSTTQPTQFVNPTSTRPVSGASSTAKPLVANTATSVLSNPVVSNSPTPTATKTVSVNPPIAIPSITPSPTVTATRIPPGLERKTMTPTPNVPPGQEKKTDQPPPKNSQGNSSKEK